MIKNTTICAENSLVSLVEILEFSQVRDAHTISKEEIEDLAEDIGANGLLHDITIYRCDHAQIVEYSQLTVRLFGQNGQVVPKRLRDHYLVLVAGHRRLAALRHLCRQGCRAYQATDSQATIEQMFDRQFPRGMVRAKIYGGISPQRALMLQLAENLERSNVPLPLQARAVVGLQQLSVLAGEPQPSAAELARSYPIRERFVGEALKFCSLPRSIQQDVETGKLGWTNALLLVRIQRQLQECKKEANEIERDLHYLATCATIKRSGKKFVEFLATWYQENLGGQTVLELAEPLTVVELMKHLLDRELIDGSTDFTHFLMAVSRARERGWLDGAGKLVPFHRPEARRAIGLMLTTQRSLLDLLDGIASQNEIETLSGLVHTNEAHLATIS